MIIKTNPDEIENFLVDASNLKGYCEAVYFPENEKEVAAILEEANKDKIPVTVSGNGTGLAGGRVPQGGIVISTEKMDKILEINTEKKFAVVEPGVILSEFQKEANSLNLLYPPDPTERNCFIGATVATNASGEKTFKYGPTRNFILELNIALANGEILALSREQHSSDGGIEFKSDKNRYYSFDIPDIKMPETKNASGYFIKNNMNAVDLFIGSEGTLGVITKIKLRLVQLPEKIVSCIVFFKDEKNALNFIIKSRDLSFKSRREKLKNSVDALALEFMDKNSLIFLQEEYSLIPQTANAAVWFEQEVSSSNEDDLLAQWTGLITEYEGDEDNVWFAVDEKERKKIEEFRHALSKKVNEYLSRNNLKKLGTDVAVPHDKFLKLYYYSKKNVEDAKINYIVYGHFGDSHMHLNMLPKDEDEYLRGKDIYQLICKKTIELSGTVSAEHGIGKLKTDYLLQMYGENIIEKMKKIKSALDPNWILGRGNIFKF